MPKKMTVAPPVVDKVAGIADADLNFNDAPHIQWILVRDARKFLSPHNPKLHDLGSIIQSINRYGFQELPKLDQTVGWIKAGNGRIEALTAMEKEHDGDGKPVFDLPRGLALDGEGQWVMPLLVGTNAVNENEALAYLVDANNLTMLGGDYSPYEISKMWDVNQYNALLQRMAQDNVFSVSMDRDDVRVMDAALQGLLISLPEVKEGSEHRNTQINIILHDTSVLEDVVSSLHELIKEKGWSATVKSGI